MHLLGLWAHSKVNSNLTISICTWLNYLFSWSDNHIQVFLVFLVLPVVCLYSFTRTLGSFKSEFKLNHFYLHIVELPIFMIRSIKYMCRMLLIMGVISNQYFEFSLIHKWSFGQILTGITIVQDIASRIKLQTNFWIVLQLPFPFPKSGF